MTFANVERGQPIKNPIPINGSNLIMIIIKPNNLDALKIKCESHLIVDINTNSYPYPILPSLVACLHSFTERVK